MNPVLFTQEYKKLTDFFLEVIKIENQSFKALYGESSKFIIEIVKNYGLNYYNCYGYSLGIKHDGFDIVVNIYDTPQKEGKGGAVGNIIQQYLYTFDNTTYKSVTWVAVPPTKYKRGDTAMLAYFIRNNYLEFLAEKIYPK